MTDAVTAGTSSTPSTAASTVDPAAAVTTQPAAEPVVAAQTEPVVAAVEPLFKLPDEIKFAPEAVTQLETFLRSKTADGKLNLTAQEVADAYVKQAMDANSRWQAQMTAQDKAWADQSKVRFTPAQRAVAEAGVGFITSKQMAAATAAGVKDAVPFRDLAKQFMNHPEFVEAMRIVGDSLKEDTFEKGAPPAAARKSLAERLYPNAKPS